MKRVPKPCRSGAVTGGPPLSRHTILSIGGWPGWHVLVWVTLAMAGARTLAMSRSSATSANPYNTAVNAIKASAANLTPGSITTTIAINGTACTTDSGCQTAIANAAGLAATVTSTYPCVASTFEFYVKYFAAGCTLTSTTSDLIE